MDDLFLDEISINFLTLVNKEKAVSEDYAIEFMETSDGTLISMYEIDNRLHINRLIELDFIDFDGKNYLIKPKGRAYLNKLKYNKNKDYKEDNHLERIEKIAEEANTVAKEANQISKNTQKRALIANWLSGVAIFISILAIITTVLLGIFFE